MPPDTPSANPRDLLARADPFGIARSLGNVQQAWLAHPEDLGPELGKLGLSLWTLQVHAWQRFTGLAEEDVVEVHPFDARFQDKVWTENAYLDVVKELYLVWTRWLQDAAFDAPGVPEKERGRAAFWTRQWLNAIAPTNYFWTNPAAVIRSVETGGQSVVKGLENFSRDLAAGTISMSDDRAFEVGGNLAPTAGAVVHRNRLLEVIQYAPTTETVHPEPVLLVAPWINKYYVLDLTEEKSLVRFLVDRGFTVLVTSWKNPGPEIVGSGDVHGADYDSTGRIDSELIAGLVAELDAEFYVCGPTRFMSEIRSGLTERGIPENRIHTETFGPVG